MLDRRFALMLADTDGIGPVRYQKIIEKFENLDEFKSRGTTDIFKECGLTGGLAEKILGFDNWAKFDKILERASQLNVEILCLGQDGYPENLTNIYAPPIVIYVKGETSYLNKPSVAIVGSRTPTSYGRSMANRIASELAAKGLVIISGLASGIDSEAHQAALDVGGVTGAIFGSGIDVIYPPEHRQLAEKICQNGYYLSEFPFGTAPERHNFPRRNRVISGLSLAVVVVEAANKSGALVTANIAADQGKDVFAVPGPADSPKSDGTINLIKQGAYVATSAEDILQNFGWESPGASSPADQKTETVKVKLEPNEQKVCDMIASGPLHFDELVRNLNLPSSELSAILLKLELAGLVARRPGNYLTRT